MSQLQSQVDFSPQPVRQTIEFLFTCDGSVKLDPKAVGVRARNLLDPLCNIVQRSVAILSHLLFRDTDPVQLCVIFPQSVVNQ